MADKELVLDDGQDRGQHYPHGKVEEPQEPKKEKEKKRPAPKIRISLHR
jgi:hypothetical protein